MINNYFTTGILLLKIDFQYFVFHIIILRHCTKASSKTNSYAKNKVLMLTYTTTFNIERRFP